MTEKVVSHHWINQKIPAGGVTYGTGFVISWQNGSQGTGADRKPQNGAFVEDILNAAEDRLRVFQETQFACTENARAIEAIREAIRYLTARTIDRKLRGVEGTLSP